MVNYNLKIIDTKTTFIAFDGPHLAEINNDLISLKMIDVEEIIVNENSVFAFTGTQHHVELVDDLKQPMTYKDAQYLEVEVGIKLKELGYGVWQA